MTNLTIKNELKKAFKQVCVDNPSYLKEEHFQKDWNSYALGTIWVKVRWDRDSIRIIFSYTGFIQKVEFTNTVYELKTENVQNDLNEIRKFLNSHANISSDRIWSFKYKEFIELLLEVEKSEYYFFSETENPPPSNLWKEQLLTRLSQVVKILLW